MVESGVTYYLAFAGDNLDVRPVMIGIDHYKGRVGLGKGKAERGRTLSGRYLRNHVIVGQVSPIVIWGGRLSLVREPAGALVLIPYGPSCLWKDRENTVIVNPGTGLVGLLETANLVGSVGVSPPITVLTCLGYPEIHTPRQGDGRVGVAGREGVLGLGTDQRTHVVDRPGDMGRGHGRHRQRKHRGAKGFQSVHLWF